jgi:5-methylcytosine-specific restriction endonuclease McrA
MKSIRERKPRLRLNPDSYRKVRSDVLRRDGWRCQNCGTSQCLQVHHIRSRSALGDDAAENLITLCAACHRQVHCLSNKR